MTSSFAHGFIFGKFLPFHTGHQALISFALAHCQTVTVLVCASDRESLPGSLRASWIEETFAGTAGLKVQAFAYREEDLPNTSVSSREVSRAWAAAFQQLVPDAAVVVTSEPYGDFVAEFMGIVHLPFDPARARVPVRATDVRADLPAWWNFLPRPVQQSLGRRVAVLGTESTGKTTLSRRLAAYFGATLVSEAGRDLVQDSNAFSLSDLYRVAEAHAARIASAAATNPCLMALDTDVHITQSYARFVFGKPLDLPASIYALNRADVYLYLCPDVPFVQDGTRLDESDRNRLDACHRETLAEYGIHFQEIRGNWDERWVQAMAAVKALLCL